jgi:hypothetical protein
VHPDTAQLISSIAIGIGGIGVALIGYFAPDADKVIIKGIDEIEKIVNVVEGNPAVSQSTKEVASDIDTVLSSLQTSIESNRSKLLTAQNRLQEAQQLKAGFKQTMESLKNELNTL